MIFGLYPMLSAAAAIFSLVFRLMRGLFCRALETVEAEIFSSLAISWMVGSDFLCIL
jgi:hypothetical protein